MRVAAASAVAGAGVTIIGAFASSLGLSVRQQRIAFGFGVLLVVIGVALMFYERRERSNPMGGEQSHGVNRSIHTEHQSGGVNMTGDVHVTVSAPQPSGEATSEQTEQGYLTTIPVRLQDGYAAGNVMFVVKNAPSLKHIGLNRVGGGAIQQMGLLTIDGSPATGVVDPAGRDYLAVIATEVPEPNMEVQALVDVNIQ
jgi:hypothetical protein